MSDPILPPPSAPQIPSYPAPFPPPAMGIAEPQKSPVLAIVALVLAVVIAPVGFILAIIALATARGRKSAKIMGWIALGVSVVITAVFVVAIVWVVQTTNSAEKTSTEFVKDLQSGDATSAYALTSPQFRAVESQNALSNLVSTAGSNLQGTLHVTDRAVRVSTNVGEFTEIQYELDGPSGTSYIQVKLVKSGGDWKVAYFDQSHDKQDVYSN